MPSSEGGHRGTDAVGEASRAGAGFAWRRKRLPARGSRLPGVLTRSGLLTAAVFAFEATATTAERVAGLRVVLHPWRLERGPLTVWRSRCAVERVVELGVSEEPFREVHLADIRGRAENLADMSEHVR